MGVPDTALKHLPAVLSPVLGGVNHILAAIPVVNALRTRRALANHGRVMAEQQLRYSVQHEMVDDVPDAHQHPAAASP